MIPAAPQTNFNNFLKELIDDPDVDMVEIPEYIIVFATVAFQLYKFIRNTTHQPQLLLEHFVSCSINEFISINHPSHKDIVNILYQDAIDLLNGN